MFFFYINFHRFYLHSFHHLLIFFELLNSYNYLYEHGAVIARKERECSRSVSQLKEEVKHLTGILGSRETRSASRPDNTESSATSNMTIASATLGIPAIITPSIATGIGQAIGEAWPVNRANRASMRHMSLAGAEGIGGSASALLARRASSSSLGRPASGRGVARLVSSDPNRGSALDATSLGAIDVAYSGSDPSSPMSPTETTPVVEEEVVVPETSSEIHSSFVFGWGLLPSASYTRTSTRKSTDKPTLIKALRGKSISQIAAGSDHCLFLSDAGDVYSWGGTHTSIEAPIVGREARVIISGPRLITMLALEKALRGIRIRFIASGSHHSLAVDELGEVYSWGNGLDGRLGHGDQEDQVSPRKVISLVARKIVHAACGGAHTVAVSDIGEIFTWGRGHNGRLGHDDTKDHYTPVLVSALKRLNIVKASCGHNFTVAISDTGLVYCWGRGDQGQCGYKHMQDQLSPRKIEIFTGLAEDRAVVSVSCGVLHTLALCRNGDMYSWGTGEFGQLGLRGVHVQAVPAKIVMSPDVSSTDRVMTQVSCGSWHSISLSTSGMVFSWGRNAHNVLGLSAVEISKSPRLRLRSHAIVDKSRGSPASSSVGLKADDMIFNEPQLLARLPRKGLVNIEAGLDFSFALWFNDAVESPPIGSIVRVGDSAVLERREASSLMLAPPLLSPSERRRSKSSNGIFSKASFSGSSLSGVSAERSKISKQTATIKAWHHILLHWDTEKMTTKTRFLWRQGIPASIRGHVWPLAIGNALKITPQLLKMYRKRSSSTREHLRLAKLRRDSAASVTRETLLLPASFPSLPRGGDSVSIGGGSVIDSIGREESIQQIVIDLPRTFPALRFFGGGEPFYHQLREVLEVFVCYRPDLGYIQGMSYVAAMLCLYTPGDSYLSFQSLTNILVSQHLFAFYRLDKELIKAYCDIFDDLLHENRPALCEKLKSLDITHEMYLFQWMQTVFLKVLPLEIASRVWDIFLLDGTSYLFRVAVAILTLFEPVFKTAPFEEIAATLTASKVRSELWEERIDEGSLFKAIELVSMPLKVAKNLDSLIHDVYFYNRGESETIETTVSEEDAL